MIKKEKVPKEWERQSNARQKVGVEAAWGDKKGVEVGLHRGRAAAVVGVGHEALVGAGRAPRLVGGLLVLPLVELHVHHVLVLVGVAKRAVFQHRAEEVLVGHHDVRRVLRVADLDRKE